MENCQLDSLFVETWTPTASLPLDKFKDHAALFKGSVDIIDQGHILDVPVFHCRSAKPHVDTCFPTWGALWVLNAGIDHKLWVADHQPKGYGDTTRRPLKSPHWRVPLIIGNLVLFNAHRTHWLPQSDDGQTLVWLAADFHERPSKEAVEQKFVALFAGLAMAPENVA